MAENKYNKIHETSSASDEPNRLTHLERLDMSSNKREVYDHYLHIEAIRDERNEWKKRCDILVKAERQNAALRQIVSQSVVMEVIGAVLLAAGGAYLSSDIKFGIIMLSAGAAIMLASKLIGSGWLFRNRPPD
ncbi:MAG: hypothetical protein Phyf2KO_14070 [Phycisphaerales bacterium]